VNTLAATPTGPPRLWGRSFVNPLFDYLLIGGGLSLVCVILLLVEGGQLSWIRPSLLPVIILASTASHFAASTVRLYTKPGAFRALPFLTMGFPLTAIAVLTVCMFFAQQLGPHMQSLYLTWSPYHYAAQAYGLAVMYSYRSGCALQLSHKRMLRWISLLPFFYNFLTAPDVGLRWLAPDGWLQAAGMKTALVGVHYTLWTLAFAAPVWLFIKIWRETNGPLPLISLLTVITNGVWFFALPPLDAFVYATIFHGIQYLAITIIFHLRDQLARDGNRHGRTYHVAWFYGASLLLGYGLFNCLPQAYIWSGFGQVESVLLVVAAINLHHFIVDGYIWKLGRGDSNRRVVESDLPAVAGG